MVYVGLMLREQRGLALWSALMGRGGPWRGVVLEAIRKLPESQIDGNVYLVLDEVLSMPDVELQARALDIIKIRRFGQRAPKAVMQKVCGLAEHDEESIRRRVMLAIGSAPTEVKLPILQRALCDSQKGVRENALTGTLALPSEAALPLLLWALHDADNRHPSDAADGLARVGRDSVAPLVAALRDSAGYAGRWAASALVQIGPPSVGPLIAALGDGDGVCGGRR